MKEKHQKLELLAPAGSFDSLRAAVMNGADAVYLGGGRFNARMNASNFTEEDLCRAMDYAHERGAKIYITLNTLLKNEEMEDALRFAAFAHRQGADAFIIQDQGLLRALGRLIPDMVIHASTQMTVTNAESVNVLEKLGVARVVLSRELSLEEIEEISAKTGAELEIFVHGALCVCYSGQCLMSSFIGGRSGNRGACAQPCRLPWSLSRNGESYGKASYLISPRDLMAIDFLPELQKAGVVSLKLEGRMKSPEYVAIVTSIYRKYLDLLESVGEKEFKVEDGDREKLKQAFNRGGFTQSYLKGDRDFKNLVYTAHPKNQGVLIGKVLDIKPLYAKISLDKPLNMGDGLEFRNEDMETQSMIVTDIMQNGAHARSVEAGTTPWVGDIKIAVKKGSEVYKTLSKPLFEEAQKTYEHGEAALVPLDMHFEIMTGSQVTLEVKDLDGNNIAVKSEILAEKAVNKPLSTERIKEQLQKTGDTPYWLREIEIESDGESTIPVSALNALRRTALDDIKRIRIEKYHRSFGEIQENGSAQAEISDNLKGVSQDFFPGNNLSLSAYFYKLPDTLSGFNGLLSRVYLPIVSRRELEKLKQEFKGELFLWTPSILKDSELDRTLNSLNEFRDLFDGLTYGNPGTLKHLKQTFPDKSLAADYSMNLFNNEALQLQKSLGAETAVLSPELRLNEVQTFSHFDLALEALVYGRIPLMTMEHCPSSTEGGCSQLCARCAKRDGYLKDRKGEVFPFVRDPILRRTQIFNAMPMLMDDTSALKETHLSLLRLTFTNEDIHTCENIARHYSNKLKGIDDPEDRKLMQELKDRGFTKGHWFRGV